MVAVIASQPHYADHIAPIAALIDGHDDVALVASHADLVKARRLKFRRLVLAQHGAGQSYSSDHPSYPGGRDNADVGLFLVPGEHPAGRWRSAYPAARVEVVGSPRLDGLPRRQNPADGPRSIPHGPVVAVSTHWDGHNPPEAGSAWKWMVNGLHDLVARYEVLGHGHPKRLNMRNVYRRMGVEYVASFDEVCARADVYICDNSSTLFEFAATGRPVVVVDAPSYRAKVHHGLRFWDAADVGVRVPATGDLVEAVAHALADPPDVRERREAALDMVYAYREGAAQRSADAIMEWVA